MPKSKAKPSKPAGKLFTPTAPPQIGDKVIPNDSQLVFEIIKIASDGAQSGLSRLLYCPFSALKRVSREALLGWLKN
jgi:hypothetical protein